MPVLEWRGHKLRLDESGTEMTLGQARVVKRFTGLRLVAFQTALQEMVSAKDLDPELMQAFLWLLLDQNGQHMDIADLDDVTLEELTTALGTLVADGVPPVVDPTAAPAEESDPAPAQ